MSEVSAVMLDRYLADDVSAEQRARIEAAIARSPELAARVAALREERSAFLARHPAELVAARIAQQSRRKRSTVVMLRTVTRRTHWLAPALATAASVALVFKLWPHPETVNAPPPPASIVTHDAAPPAQIAPATPVPALADAPQATGMGGGFANTPGTSGRLGAVAAHREAKSAKKAYDTVLDERSRKDSIDDKLDSALAEKEPSAQGKGGDGANVRGSLADGISEERGYARPPPPAAEPAPTEAQPRAKAEAPARVAAPPPPATPHATEGAASVQPSAPADDASELRRAAPAKEKAGRDHAPEADARPAPAVSGRFVRGEGAAHAGDTVGFTLSSPAFAVVLAQSGSEVRVVFDASHARVSTGRFALQALAQDAQTLWLFAASEGLDVQALVASMQAHHPQRPQAVLPLHLQP